MAINPIYQWPNSKRRGPAAKPKGFVQDIRRIDSDIVSMELIRTTDSSFEPRFIGREGGYKIGVYTKYDRFLIYSRQRVNYKGEEIEVDELFLRWCIETMNQNEKPAQESVDHYRNYPSAEKGEQTETNEEKEPA